MKKTIYAKYSRERRAKFQIMTCIMEDAEGVRSVEKTALRPEAAAHVTAMARNAGRLEQLYQDPGLKICPCKMSGDRSVVFPWIRGKNMDLLLTEHLEAGQFEQAKADVEFLWRVLSSSAGLAAFEMSGQFEQMFGRVQLPEGMLAAPLSNLDMLFANILVDDEYVLTDYEWVFDFMIPIQFLFARSLMLQGKVYALEPEQQQELYAIGGVRLEDLEVYYQMEVHFQKYVTGEGEVNILSNLYPKMETGSYQLGDLDTDHVYFHVRLLGVDRKGQKRVTLYDALHRIPEVEESVRIPETERYQTFVLQPVDTETVLRLDSIRGRKKGSQEWVDVEPVTCNAKIRYRNDYRFLQPPEFVIENAGYAELSFSCFIYHRNDYLIKESTELRVENEQLRGELDRYMNMLPCRVWCKLKSVIKR